MALQTPARLLIIDDEPGFTRGLAQLLRRDGYCVETVGNGQAALAELQVQRYDVILCDMLMPELNGPDFYAILLRQHADLSQRVIFLTGDTLGEESREFLEKCGQPWLHKPCHAAEVRGVIQQVLRAGGA